PRLPRHDRGDARQLPVGDAGGNTVVNHREQGAGSSSIGAAADAVARRLGALEPRVAIVLGSGLGSVADAVQSAIRIPQSAIPGFPKPAAPGHKGELVAGTLEGVPVLVQSGRFHLYEGHAPQLAALPARVFARLGVRTLIVTNAAGGIRLTFRPPTLMLIADHINLMFRNPLEGAHEEVLAAGARLAGQLATLIRGVLARL